jgi:hypothetical protein
LMAIMWRLPSMPATSSFRPRCYEDPTKTLLGGRVFVTSPRFAMPRHVCHALPCPAMFVMFDQKEDPRNKLATLFAPSVMLCCVRELTWIIRVSERSLGSATSIAVSAQSSASAVATAAGTP